uniref:Beta-lactamase n=1 Tax=Magnetococcus massalia (strain MO-1) TaxID=451514 RepID=A0A1S7LLV5_MAGMO|nr:conserved protein of unknown function [Include 4 Sel1 repeat] [Candidatus Magnetococcus massalia]
MARSRRRLFPILFLLLTVLLLVNSLMPSDPVGYQPPVDDRQGFIAQSDLPEMVKSKPLSIHPTAEPEAIQAAPQATESTPEPISLQPKEATALHRCDELAASPNDPATTGLGVELAQIDGPAAEEACRDAVAQYPHIARYKMQLGRALQKQTKWMAARKNYEAAAGRGDVAAQYLLGSMLVRGLGGQKSLRQGVSLVKQAAVAKLPAAQYFLGVLHANGRGVRKDDKQALAWLRQAAMGGSREGMFNLGKMLFMGRDGKQKKQEGFRWIKQAAEKGLAEAQFIMGQFAERGLGMQRNRDAAIQWYQQAAKQGHYKAREKIRRNR